MSDHEFRDVQVSMRSVGQVYARCWCGWHSRETPMAEVARALHAEHVDWLAAYRARRHTP